MDKTIKQIMEENKNLYDDVGVFGELPLTENNINHIPDKVEINCNVVKYSVDTQEKGGRLYVLGGNWRSNFYLLALLHVL